jgi:sugar/nucleoside kinase (ribokinase family)
MPLLVHATLCLDDLDVPGVGSVRGVLGGAAAYFAAAARRFGPVRLLAAVGEDYPDDRWQELLDLGIDPAGIVRRPGKTFRWHGAYHDDLKHRDTRLVAFDPAVEALPDLPTGWEDTTHVCLGVTDPRNQLALRRRLPHAKLAVLDTIDLYIQQHRGDLRAAIAAADGVVVNDTEAGWLTGATDPAAAATKLLAFGPRFAVVKAGAGGAVLAKGDATWPCPAVPIEKGIDPTGAGDAFLGGMMGHLASTDADAENDAALRRGIVHGSVAASFTIEAFGVDGLRNVENAEYQQRFSALSKRAIA